MPIVTAFIYLKVTRHAHPDSRHFTGPLCKDLI